MPKNTPTPTPESDAIAAARAEAERLTARVRAHHILNDQAALQGARVRLEQLVKSAAPQPAPEVAPAEVAK